MFDFEYLEKLKPTDGKTERFYFDEIPGRPWVDVLPATQSNKPYWKALMKVQAARGRTSGRQNPAMQERRMREGRDTDRQLYPEYNIRGWGDVPGKTSDGTVVKVPFDKENVRAFLAKLPDRLFDELRVFCSEDGNFAEGIGDGEELAKV